MRVRAPRSSFERARSARPWSRAFSRPSRAICVRADTFTRSRITSDDSPGCASCNSCGGTPGHPHGQVQPIAERSGESRGVACDLRRRTAAGADRVVEEPAGTRVHRADQHEPRGEDGRSRRPGDADRPFFDGLAKHFEHVTAELGHLVEEEHSVVREADLAGTRVLAAADERHVRDGVMRSTERPLAKQSCARRQETGDGMDRRTSSASSNVSAGRIVATRRAIMVLPAPGGPIIRTL